GITSVNHPNAINNDAKDLWKGLTYDYQEHVTISPNGSSDRIDDTNETDIRKKIFIEDLRTRKDVKHENIAYENKINDLSYMAKGLNDIHNAGKIHKDLHPGNILLTAYITPYISDLGMCQPVNQPSIKEGIYGVLPYIDPEVLRGHQYTKSSDIYSLGIIMNEYFSEELPYANKSHDIYLAIEICGGQRPKISEDTPKPLANLIKRCWDPRVENRPTAKQLYQTLHKLDIERHQTNITQTHPQAIYTSRFLNYKDLLKTVNALNTPKSALDSLRISDAMKNETRNTPLNKDLSISI
ncbi:9093_t:CDS:2, partial [Funneliformis geosporum]